MSEQITFEVSAKTARLIGRENIAGVNGALLELIKNSYDADASICKVLFRVPFPSVRPSYDADIVREVLDESDIKKLENYYSYIADDNIYRASHSFSDDEIITIQKLLFRHNTIMIIDNGIGMTSEVIKNSWMRIGTNDKEVSYVSEKGRVKTGAKGIGRFALDKLATNTILYTKSKFDSLVSWQIDWNKFDKNKNLSDISATIDYPSDKTFSEIITELLGEQEYKKIEEHGFETGTVIILNPTREPWTDRLIKSLNNNLRSINPLKSVDRFDVTVDNVFYNSLSFKNEDMEMKEDDYDYYVTADFDGKSTINVVIQRNELDVNSPDFAIASSFGDEASTFSVEDFWKRSKFSIAGYTKKEYSEPFKLSINAADVVNNYLQSDLDKLGKFHFEFYFMKNTSGDLEITKKVNSSRRKDILNLYSGIKIYRDNFKVRPYGDKGTAFYDWLNLGERSQKSPAAVTHKDGNWRVEPYQIVGSLSIGRIENPFLVDMANREGLNPNETYNILVDLLQEVISKFEYDRQYFLREFKIAKDEIREKSNNRINRIIQEVASQKKQPDKSKNRHESNDGEQEFSKEDYADAIDYLVDKKENDISEEDVLMLLSISGTTTNTFAHEISSLEGLIGSFPSQIRACLQRIVPEDKYEGPQLFNPYTIISDHENTEKILSSWIGTLVKGVKEDSLKLNVVNVNDIVEDIVEGWKDLLATKFIEILLDLPSEKIKCCVRKADLLLIINNFILNSAWFLEKTTDRKIFVDLIDQGDLFIIQMENNGEPIHDNFKENPYKMFELRTTTKYDKNGERVGTGIGLWMLQKATRKYNGDIIFHDLKHGTFGFSVKIPKGSEQ